MSIVVAVNTEDTIFIGADSAVTYGDTIVLVPDAKLFRAGDIIAGGAGSADQVSLFRVFLSEIQKQKEIDNSLTGMVDLWANFQLYAKQLDIELYENDCVLSQFLVVLDKQPWLIEGFSCRPVTTFETVGAGSMPARTALHLGHGIVEALDVACHFEAGCRYPLYVYTISKNGGETLLTKHEQSGIVSAQDMPS